MRTRVTALLLSLLVVASPLATAIPGDGTPGHRDNGQGEPPFDHGPLAVVAPEDWRDILQPLMDWRNRTSRYGVHFVPYEEAVARGTGHDNAARLKQWLLSRFAASDGPEALLLVGDADVIPVRRVFADILQDGNVSDPLNFRWTDDYYAYGVEVEWDRDGDLVYGEDGEVLDEVAKAFARRGDTGRLVGRIPASTALELDRFVDKLLAYEQDPEPGDWYTSALLVSGLMDVPNHLDNPYTPDVDGGYELFSDNSYESHSRLIGELPERYDTTWLWDYPFLEGGHWNLSVDTMDHASVVNAFDRGHSIVGMNGHGWIDGSGLAHYNGSGYSNYWWDWSNAYDYADAANASNGGRLPWVYVAACYVGDVTIAGDRTLERLVMNPDGGAIGLVAGNGENYKGESMSNASFGNWFLERNFWLHYFESGPAEAMHWTKAAYLDLVSSDDVPHTDLFDAYYIADYLSHNLLGDPLTRTWTDAPGELRINGLELLDGHPRVRVVDGGGFPVPGAVVSIDGGSLKDVTGEDGWAHVFRYPDGEDVEVTVSARNHRTLETVLDAVHRDISVADVFGEADRPVVGSTVTLTALIETHGDYPYEQARVRFSVAHGDGELERLVPDLYATVSYGSLEVVERDWAPSEPGPWRIRAEVDPLDEVPNHHPHNDAMEAAVMVMGPPGWKDLPASVDIACGDGPGGQVDLLPYVSDPDTPLDELNLSASYVSGPGLPTDVRIHVDGNGRLWICSNITDDFIHVMVRAEDGTFSAEEDLRVNLTRDVGRLRLVAPPPGTVTLGQTAQGQVTIEDLGYGADEELQIRPLVVDGQLHMDLNGNFTFVPQVPGTHHIWVGVTRADGTSAPTWEPALLVFRVLPVNAWPPQLVGVTELRLVEREVGRVQLQVVDLEGDPVSLEVVEDGGIGATLEQGTNVLTLRPKKGDEGVHQVVVRLSDGVNSEDVTISVVVDPPASAAGGFAALVIVIFAAMVLAVWWRRRTGALEHEDPNGNETESG